MPPKRVYPRFLPSHRHLPYSRVSFPPRVAIFFLILPPDAHAFGLQLSTSRVVASCPLLAPAVLVGCVPLFSLFHFPADSPPPVVSLRPAASSLRWAVRLRLRNPFPFSREHGATGLVRVEHPNDVVFAFAPDLHLPWLSHTHRTGQPAANTLFPFFFFPSAFPSVVGLPFCPSLTRNAYPVRRYGSTMSFFSALQSQGRRVRF